MAKPRIQDVTPTAPFVVALNAPEGPSGLLERLWRDSTHFAFVWRGVMVDDADLMTPTPALQRLLAAVEPFRGSMESALWVTDWPGTRSGRTPGHFWLRGKATHVPPFPLDARTLWSRWGGWEDLQLYKGDTLQFYVCSHEGFGFAWGTERLFRELELEAKPVTRPVPVHVAGVAASPSLMRALNGDTTPR